MLRYTRRTTCSVVCVMKLRARGFHVGTRVSAEPGFSNRGNAEDDLRERCEKDSGSPQCGRQHPREPGHEPHTRRSLARFRRRSQQVQQSLNQSGMVTSTCAASEGATNFLEP